MSSKPDSFASLVERLSTPHLSVRRFTVHSIFDRLSLSKSGIKTPATLSTLKKCLTHENSEVVDQSCSEFIKLLESNIVTLDEGLIELLAALSSANIESIPSLCNTIGVLCRLKLEKIWEKNSENFQSLINNDDNFDNSNDNSLDTNFNHQNLHMLDSFAIFQISDVIANEFWSIHPFVTALKAREEVMEELIHQTHLILLHFSSQEKLFFAILSFKPLFSSFLSEKKVSLIELKFFRLLHSQMIRFGSSSIHFTFPVLNFLSSFLPRRRLLTHQERELVVFTSEEIIDLLSIQIKNGLNDINKKQVQNLTEQILNHLFSLSLEFQKMKDSPLPIIKIIFRFIKFAIKCSFFRRLNAECYISAIVFLLISSHLEREQFLLFSLLEIFLFGDCNESSTPIPFKTNLHVLSMAVFPSLHFMAFPSSSFKSISSRILHRIEFEFSQESIKDKSISSQKDENSIIEIQNYAFFGRALEAHNLQNFLFLLWKNRRNLKLWTCLNPSHSFFHSENFVNVAEKRAANLWLENIILFLNKKREEKKSSGKSSSEIFLDDDTLLSLSIIITSLSLYPEPKVRVLAAKAMAALGRLEPIWGLSLLPTVLFCLRMAENLGGESCPLVQVSLLQILPHISLHWATASPVLNALLPMIKPSNDIVLQSLSLQLQCEVWKQKDKIFSYMEPLLSPSEINKEYENLSLILAKAACIKEVCMHDATRGIDLILSIQACISHNQPKVCKLGFDSLGLLCEADAIDFYTAWKVVLKYYPSLPSSPLLASSFVSFLQHGAMDAKTHPEECFKVAELLWIASMMTNESKIEKIKEKIEMEKNQEKEKEEEEENEKGDEREKENEVKKMEKKNEEEEKEEKKEREEEINFENSWISTRVNALKSLSLYDIEVMEEIRPFSFDKVTQILLNEKFSSVKEAAEVVIVKGILYEYRTRKRGVVEKEASITSFKSHKLIQALPRLICSPPKQFTSIIGVTPASVLPGASLLCFLPPSPSPPEDKTSVAAKKKYKELTITWEKWYSDVAKDAAEKLSWISSPFISLISLHAWISFMHRWLNARKAIFLAESSNMDASVAEDKAALSLWKDMQQMCTGGIPRVKQNMNLAVAGFCIALNPSMHSLVNTCVEYLKSFLIDSTQQFYHASASLALGHAMSALHPTEWTKKTEIANLLSNILDDPTVSSEIRFSCASSLSIICKSLLPSHASMDWIVRDKELALLIQIIEKLLQTMVRICPYLIPSFEFLCQSAPVWRLQIYPKPIPASKSIRKQNTSHSANLSTSSGQNNSKNGNDSWGGEGEGEGEGEGAVRGEEEEEFWVVIGCLMALGNATAAIGRAQGHSLVLAITEMLASWIPSQPLDWFATGGEEGEEGEGEIDAQFKNPAYCFDVSPALGLLAGACLALPACLSVAFKLELIKGKTIDSVMGRLWRFINYSIQKPTAESGSDHTKPPNEPPNLNVSYSEMIPYQLFAAVSLSAGAILDASLSVGHPAFKEDMGRLMNTLLDASRNCHVASFRSFAALGIANCFGARVIVSGPDDRLLPLSEIAESASAARGSSVSEYVTVPVLADVDSDDLVRWTAQQIVEKYRKEEDVKSMQMTAWALSLFHHALMHDEKVRKEGEEEEEGEGRGRGRGREVSGKGQWGNTMQSLPENGILRPLLTWLFQMSASEEKYESATSASICFVLRCLSKAPRLPAVDWSGIVLRLIRNSRPEPHPNPLSLLSISSFDPSDQDNDATPLFESDDVAIPDRTLPIECLKFAITQSSKSTSLISFLDHVSDFEQMISLDLPTRVYLIRHVSKLFDLFSESRSRKLLVDCMRACTADMSFDFFAKSNAESNDVDFYDFPPPVNPAKDPSLLPKDNIGREDDDDDDANGENHRHLDDDDDNSYSHPNPPSSYPLSYASSADESDLALLRVAMWQSLADAFGKPEPSILTDGNPLIASSSSSLSVSACHALREEIEHCIYSLFSYLPWPSTASYHSSLMQSEWRAAITCLKKMKIEFLNDLLQSNDGFISVLAHIKLISNQILPFAELALCRKWIIDQYVQGWLKEEDDWILFDLCSAMDEAAFSEKQLWMMDTLDTILMLNYPLAGMKILSLSACLFSTNVILFSSADSLHSLNLLPQTLPLLLSQPHWKPMASNVIKKLVEMKKGLENNPFAHSRGKKSFDKGGKGGGGGGGGYGELENEEGYGGKEEHDPSMHSREKEGLVREGGGYGEFEEEKEKEGSYAGKEENEFENREKEKEKEKHEDEDQNGATDLNFVHIIDNVLLAFRNKDVEISSISIN